MKSYRIYFAKDGGRLEQGETFACGSDAEAIARARETSAPAGAAVELWEGGRLVVRIPASNRT